MNCEASKLCCLQKQKYENYENKQLWLTLIAALALHITTAHPVVFTTKNTIGLGDVNYDGQGIVANH